MATKKHPRRLPLTPNSQIRSALRQLWLRSRERGQAVKDQKNTCQRCGRKGSVAKGREVKINVHHREGVDWDGLLALIRERLMQTPDKYECLCEECHNKEHHGDKEPGDVQRSVLPGGGDAERAVPAVVHGRE